MDVIEELNNKSILPSEMLVMLKKLKLFETTTDRIEGIKMDDMITSNIKCRCLNRYESVVNNADNIHTPRKPMKKTRRKY